MLKVSVLISMGISIGSGILVARLVQGVPFAEILKICIVGYHASGNGLGAILNGGGLVSMLEIVVILLISSSYSGIFNGTGMLLCPVVHRVLCAASILWCECNMYSICSLYVCSTNYIFLLKKTLVSAEITE